MNVGLLSSINDPLLPLFLMRCQGISNINVFPILDLKMYSQKDTNLWIKRTNETMIKEAFSNYISVDVLKIEKPFYFVANHNSTELLELIDYLDLQCFLNAGTPRKISPSIIKNIEKGILNIHPGIFPKYRGCSSIEWAILNNDQIGNTAHLMTSDYDAGPIVKIEKYDLSQTFTYTEIRSHVLLRSIEMAADILNYFANQSYEYIIKSSLKVDFKSFPLLRPISSSLEQAVINKANHGLYKY